MPPFFFLPKNTAPFDIFSLRSTRRCVMVRRHQHDMKCEHQCIGGQMVAVPAVPLDGDLAVMNFYWLLMAYSCCALNCQHTLHVQVSSASYPRFGRPSITTYQASAKGLWHHQALSLLFIRIVTGRKHQIRVHSAHIGHPATWRFVVVVKDG